jgi:hypothetical protein
MLGLARHQCERPLSGGLAAAGIDRAEVERLAREIGRYQGEWNDQQYKGSISNLMPDMALVGNGDVGVMSGGSTGVKLLTARIFRPVRHEDQVEAQGGPPAGGTHDHLRRKDGLLPGPGRQRTASRRCSTELAAARSACRTRGLAGRFRSRTNHGRQVLSTIDNGIITVVTSKGDFLRITH